MLPEKMGVEFFQSTFKFMHLEANSVSDFPEFMHDRLDEINSVKFRVDENGRRLVGLSEVCLPEFESSTTEESDSSEGDFSYSDLSGSDRRSHRSSRSFMSDPLSYKRDLLLMNQRSSNKQVENLVQFEPEQEDAPLM